MTIKRRFTGVKLTWLRMTCGGYPSQWTGSTTKQGVYIRYRHGGLSVSFMNRKLKKGHQFNFDLEGQRIFIDPECCGECGEMTTERMLKLTGFSTNVIESDYPYEVKDCLYAK